MPADIKCQMQNNRVKRQRDMLLSNIL